MPQFRKKPVVIEAVQVSALLASFGSQAASWPQWAFDAYNAGILQLWIQAGNNGVIIKTLEGELAGNNADWIIRGVQGELYPCKPEIFAATYEAVDMPSIARLDAFGGYHSGFDR